MHTTLQYIIRMYKKNLTLMPYIMQNVIIRRFYYGDHDDKYEMPSDASSAVWYITSQNQNIEKIRYRIKLQVMSLHLFKVKIRFLLQTEIKKIR